MLYESPFTKKWSGQVKPTVFYGLENSHEDLNSYEFFKLLLASDIYNLALFCRYYHLRRIVFTSSIQKYTINLL